MCRKVICNAVLELSVEIVAVQCICGRQPERASSPTKLNVMNGADVERKRPSLEDWRKLNDFDVMRHCDVSSHRPVTRKCNRATEPVECDHIGAMVQ